MAESIVGMAFIGLVCVGLGYFFVVTRGALIAHAFVPRAEDRFHIYWVYSNMGLIRFSDKKPWVAAVFLFHELPDPGKERAFREAARVVAPGGKLIIAEFHRPRSWLMRQLGRIYFTIFEPYALGMWGRYDPVAFMGREGGWRCERSTYFFGNFQAVVATKRP